MIMLGPAHRLDRPIRREPTTSEIIVNYGLILEKFERQALFSTPPTTPQNLAAEAASIKQQFRHYGIREIEFQPLDFYVAAAWHGEALMYRNAFLAFAAKETVSIKNLKPEDIAAIYIRFPDREKLEQSETMAAKSYQEARVGAWKTGHFADRLQAELLAIDLEDGRITRHKGNAAAAAKERQKLLKQLQSVIECLPTSGRRSEMELVYLLRNWAIESGVSHLVQVEHGLPQEDMARQKIDIRLLVGDLQIPLQIKTETHDNYRTEFYRRVRAKAALSVMGTGTNLVCIDTEALSATYALTVHPPIAQGEKLKFAAAKKAVLNTLLEGMPEEGRALLEELLFPVKKEKKSPAKEKGKKTTLAFALRNSGVPILRKFGLLGNDISAQAILKAKERLQELFPSILSVLTTEAEYLTPTDDQLKKLKAALEEKAA